MEAMHGARHRDLLEKAQFGAVGGAALRVIAGAPGVRQNRNLLGFLIHCAEGSRFPCRDALPGRLYANWE